jgi:hypothetical protein
MTDPLKPDTANSHEVLYGVFRAPEHAKTSDAGPYDIANAYPSAMKMLLNMTYGILAERIDEAPYFGGRCDTAKSFDIISDLYKERRRAKSAAAPAPKSNILAFERRQRDAPKGDDPRTEGMDQ